MCKLLKTLKGVQEIFHFFCFKGYHQITSSWSTLKGFLLFNYLKLLIIVPVLEFSKDFWFLYQVICVEKTSDEKKKGRKEEAKEKFVSFKLIQILLL